MKIKQTDQLFLEAFGLPNLVPFKQHTVRSVMLQTMKTNEFYGLFQYLQSSGVTPLVVKGIISFQNDLPCF